MSGATGTAVLPLAPPRSPTLPPPALRPVCSLRLTIPEDGDLQRAAQQLVDGCKLLHPQRVGEVAALLQQAAQRQREAAPEAQPGAPQSSRVVDAPQRVTEQDWELLRRQQQQYLAAAAASATQALSAAAATASLDRLDEYLVGAATWVFGCRAVACGSCRCLHRVAVTVEVRNTVISLAAQLPT